MQDLSTIYEEYYDAVFAYIISRVRYESAAEDLASSTWRKVFEKLDTFDESKGIMRQWIFGIARNEINMYHRLYYVKKFISLTGFEDSVAVNEKPALEQAQDKETSARLLAALDKLKNTERDIVALKFYSGLNNRQIAAMAKLSESNIGTIVNRAVNKLRILLEEV